MLMSAPIIIDVPESGIAESAVLRALGVAWADVAPLYGEVIGCPRDYRHDGRNMIFTREGVRRLAAHFGMEVGFADDPEPPSPAPQPARPYWWQKEDVS